MADFTVANHGTVWTFKAQTPAAKDWANEYVEVPEWAGTPESFSADWRPGRNLVEQMLADGLTVE